MEASWCRQTHSAKAASTQSLNMKNGNLFPFIGRVESITEANKNILDVLITLPVKEVTRVTALVYLHQQPRQR